MIILVVTLGGYAFGLIFLLRGAAWLKETDQRGVALERQHRVAWAVKRIPRQEK